MCVCFCVYMDLSAGACLHNVLDLEVGVEQRDFYVLNGWAVIRVVRVRVYTD